MFSTAKKSALITGASGGIGSEIAKVLHAQGASVVLAGTRSEPLMALKNTLKDRAYVLLADLRDNDAIDTLLPKAQDLIGDIHILVNNAGTTRDTLAVRMKDKDWNHVIQTNLTAAFRLCRGAIKSMMQRRWGRIVNISSVVGVAGNAGQSNYCASKAGLIGMSKALAQEVAARGITVNCVAPGFIDTAMTRALSQRQKEGILTKIPTGGMGSVRDIATAVAFLISEEAGYITGQTLHVNGGMVMV